MRMLDLLKHIDKANVTLTGDLEFVNDWQYFTEDPSAHFEQLTSTGPFAGTLGAFTTGVKLRTRYNHLLPAANTTTTLWASDSNRVIDTARYFSAGFFGLPPTSNTPADLKIIPETANLGADTLTPGDTCALYLSDTDFGHDYGAAQLSRFRSTYLPAISARLARQNPHVNLTFSDSEIYSMQEMCGFETTVRGSSPWCALFSRHEWSSFEYARDVIHYYRAGPGNRYGAAMGWLWLNATAGLLDAGPRRRHDDDDDAEGLGALFFSFVHDGDIIPMLAALDLFPDAAHLPTTHVARERKWRTSQVVPMGGRVIFERLLCSSPSSPSLSPSTSSSSSTSSTLLSSTSNHPSDPKEEEKRDIYIRININDGIVPLPGCTAGPGRSCPLAGFLEHVKRRGEEVGDFRTVCGLGPDAPDRITFLHQ
ncbi:MAG: hypothetical protein M1819_004137 [Sarea resinae]|nr:MAG: hypothetical protein M1819_004137 [Sarea resinae]